jgi:dTDP-4-dehydrorhamnose 3,5-epimerase-like enzyme
MARLIQFPTFKDERGSLTVMQKELPFVPKRCFTVYDMKTKRGGHGHQQSRTVLFALVGKINVEVRTKGQTKVDSDFYVLETPDQGLYLDAEDWHTFEALTEDAFLLCIASHEFSKDDYFYERP